MPFETLPSDGDYRDAHWYTMRMNNDDRYIAFYDDTKEQFNTGRGSNSVLHQGENSPEAMVAFMGDPFELKILNRAASETASANRYIGCASDAEDGDSLSVKTGSSDISSWEIVDDDVSGSMVLRQLGTYASPKYIGWHYGVSGNPLYYKTTSSRIKVVELEKKKYVYHIYNTANQIAIKATTQQDVGMPLSNYTDIPEIIRSPFLALPGVTVKFYHSSADALADTDAKDYAPYDVTESTHKDIYVRYFNMSTALAAYRVKLNGSQEYNVRLNGQYLSYNSSGGPSVGYVNSQATITDEQSGQEAFIWKLLGSDPYAMRVTNTTASLSSNNYVHASSTNDTFVSFGESGTAAKFIIKSGTTPNTFEVMYATGDEVDADTTYYHIGRRDANRVKIYSYDRTEGGIQHGSSNISFVLTLRGSIARFYHLVDKKNNDLLTVRTRDERLSFPGDYWSPLVGTYHYYLLSDFNVANGPDGVADTGDDIYTLKDGVQELDGFINNPPFHGTYRIIDRGTDNTAYVAASSSLTATDLADLETKIRALSSTGTYEYKVGDTEYKTVKVADDIHIYVTYTTSNRVNLRKGVLYLLKFQSGDSFRQENGADGLTTSEVPAVYPYCNGDCNFFIYGQDEYELQQQGAASTRTRWAWYVESADNDPYHVKICSRQMETYNGYNQQAYFYTFVQNIDGVNTVVTSLAWPGITGVQGTEYMVLGSVGQYQLVTSDTIYIDLNGDGDTNDEGERARQVVKAFEQYWKTYDTVKNKLLKNILEDEDKGANPEGSTTVPSVPASYRELLTGTGEGQYGFHSYNYWAYAKRFNGYNSEGKTSKGWEQIDAIPVVLVGFELELAIEFDDSFILSQAIAVERMRLAPTAFVANFIDEGVEADGRSLPRLVEHVEGEVIEEGIGISCDDEVAAIIIIVKLTILCTSCEAAAPVATETAFGCHLELDVAAILRSRNPKGELRILIWVGAVVGEFVGCVGVVPSIDRTCEVISGLDNWRLRDGFDDKRCRGGRLDSSGTIGHPHTDGGCDFTFCRTTSELLSNDSLKFISRNLTFGIEVIGVLTDIKRVIGSIAISRWCHNGCYLDHGLALFKIIEVYSRHFRHAAISERYCSGLCGLLLLLPVLVVFGAGGQPKKGCRCDIHKLLHSAYYSVGLAMK